MRELELARDLSVPLDAVTQKLAWLGRTGSGKSYACKRLVEQMLRASAQVIVIDPVGIWPGLRLGPKSFDIPVLGGLYGDIPLESTGGALVADLAVDHSTSLVLDVSHMRDAERTRFAQAFGERFFERKKKAPGAVHLVLEECQEFVPQNPQGGEERMLHEWQRIAKLGRNFGIGLSLISQRPQEVNKKALNQAECVFAFQMTGPQERKALEYWLSDKGFDGKLSELLPRLEVGAPHVWSPQWLKVSKVVRILPIDSLDTSSTPKVGEKSFAQKKLTPIDLKVLSKSMAETIERAKADDPKALRARIAELEKQNAAAQKVSPPATKIDEATLAEIKERFNELSAMFERAGIIAPRKAKPVFPAPQTEKAVEPKPRAAPLSGLAGRDTASRLGKGEKAVLTVIAQHRDGCTSHQVTVITGYKRSTRDAYLNRLRAAALIDSGVRHTATHEGLEALPDLKPLPTGQALLEHYLQTLPEGEGRVLQEIAAALPDVLSREEVSALTGYKRSTRDAYLHRLRARELILERDGGIELAAELTRP